MVPLSNVTLPINFSEIMSKIFEIAAFDLVETNDTINQILQIDDTEAFNENFEKLNLQSFYMLNNLGSLIFFYLTYPALILLYKVLNSFQNSAKCCIKAKNRLKKKIFWGMWLVGILETYAILVLCCGVGLNHLDFRSWGLIIESLACIFFAAIIILMPLFIIRLFTKSFDEL